MVTGYRIFPSWVATCLLTYCVYGVSQMLCWVFVWWPGCKLCQRAIIAEIHIQWLIVKIPVRNKEWRMGYGIAMEKMPIYRWYGELPIKSCDFPARHVEQPDGNLKTPGEKKDHEPHIALCLRVTKSQTTSNKCQEMHRLKTIGWFVVFLDMLSQFVMILLFHTWFGPR